MTNTKKAPRTRQVRIRGIVPLPETLRVLERMEAESLRHRQEKEQDIRRRKQVTLPRFSWDQTTP